VGVASASLRDRDTKFTTSFDTVFAAVGTEVTRTPAQAPRANAFAERWVRTVRQDCLDHILVVSRQHLESVLSDYLRHYNQARPHGGYGWSCGPASEQRHVGAVRCHDVLSGLIHEYERAGLTTPSGKPTGNAA